VVRLPKASPKWPIEQGGDFGGGNKYGVRTHNISPSNRFPASPLFRSPDSFL
jgi:hypothetical protein